MKKQVLVPLDGSKLAEMILPHAVAYARIKDYGLALIHVVAPPAALDSNAWGVTPAEEMWEGWEDEVESGQHYLEVVAKRLLPLDLEVYTQVVQDEPARSIVAYAENHPEVALIAMSTHGRSGLGRLLFGSVAEQVLHSSPVPMLMARPVHEKNILDDMSIPEYSSLLVPLDSSEFAAQALTQASTLAGTLGASMTLVAAAAEAPLGLELAAVMVEPGEWTPERENLVTYLKQVLHHLEGEDISVQAIVEYGPPAAAIVRAARNTHADLIVMSTHGRSGLSRVWQGALLCGSCTIQHARYCWCVPRNE